MTNVSPGFGSIKAAAFQYNVLADGGEYLPNCLPPHIDKLKRNDLYDDAILIFNPAARKADTMYGMEPDGTLIPFTVTRALDTATEVGSDGYINSVLANVPRYDYTDGVPVLLTEAETINLFLNSMVGVTQNVTVVNATQYTIYFLGGSGSIALTGATTGTVLASDFTRNNKLTFTSASTTLTCTVTGVVNMVQVELGIGSSYIPTNGATVTRNADVIQVALPSGVTTITLTDIDDVESAGSIADPYIIPVGEHKQIIMR